MKARVSIPGWQLALSSMPLGCCFFGVSFCFLLSIDYADLILIVERNQPIEAALLSIDIDFKRMAFIFAVFEDALVREALSPDREEILKIELVGIGGFDMQCPVALVGVDHLHSVRKNPDISGDWKFLPIDYDLHFWVQMERKICVLAKVDVEHILGLRFSPSQEEQRERDGKDYSDSPIKPAFFDFHAKSFAASSLFLLILCLYLNDAMLMKM